MQLGKLGEDVILIEKKHIAATCLNERCMVICALSDISKFIDSNRRFNEYSFIEARFQNKNLPSMLYIKKYIHSDGTMLLWGYNNRGKFFGLSHDFITDNVPEMIL